MAKISAGSTRLSLIVLEDCGFSPNGGILTTIIALVPELAHLCIHLVWVMPESRISIRAAELGQMRSLTYEALHSPRWRKGWLSQTIASRLERCIRWKAVEWITKALHKHAKTVRLKAIIKKHNITHVLNIGIFDQGYLELPVPYFGIVYDTNYAKSWKWKCLDNLLNWTQKADALFAISSWTRNEVIQIDPSAAFKIYAVPLAVKFPSNSGRVQQERRDPEKLIFLYPASFNPHKNHHVLLVALSKIFSEEYDFEMVFCGYNTEDMLSSRVLDDPTLEATRTFLNSAPDEFRSCIHILGMVQERELESLFQSATHVLLPSRYEGFGLPLTEAVARGLPVLCSDIPPFREQAEIYNIGKFVIFVDNSRPDSWTTAIRNLWICKPIVAMTTAEAKQVLSKWTWPDVACRYLELIQDIK
jgi:glycosyltransferase involved in cell wall biosynthesis